MAEGKKSFLIYTDSRAMVEKLSNERAGILFKTLFSYCDDENPNCDDEVIDMVFEHFKSILKRDLKKYENIIERNRQNGKKGGRPQNQNNPVGFLETQVNPSKPKKADTDNDTETDNEININVYRKFLHLSISIGEVEKLKIDYDIKTIDKILDAIENHKDNKKYKSLYLTAKNWLSKEPKKTDVKKSTPTLIL